MSYLCNMKNEQNKRHVQLPNDMTEFEFLTPQDLLVYLSIKRYMNNETKEAFPSLQTISDVCGASINTIRKCIANLVKYEYIRITKRGRMNVYHFLKYDTFEPFSYEFLDKKDLTFTEKSYIVASQQYMFKEQGEGKISMTNVELSKKINMSESTISRCDKSLENKNYVQIIKTNKRDPQTGIYIREKFYHLNELEQAIVFVLQNHEERISNNETKVQKLEDEVKSLTKTVEIILRENQELKNKNKTDDNFTM